jgi:hypothetical protein
VTAAGTAESADLVKPVSDAFVVLPPVRDPGARRGGWVLVLAWLFVTVCC